jgi:hypothetical protein
MPNLDPTTNPDVQEALSRRYSDDIIMLLPLSTRDAFAVFNSARELCGFVDVEQRTSGHGETSGMISLYGLAEAWHPPAAVPTLTKPPVDLEELDLI